MSMIERVARALALADLDPETRAVVNLDAHMLHVQKHYDELARAAIEAMREPTYEMALEGQKQVNMSEEPGLYEFLSRNEVGLIFAAMIDTALEA